MIKYKGKNYKIKFIGKFLEAKHYGDGDCSDAEIMGENDVEFPEEGDIVAILEELK